MALPEQVIYIDANYIKAYSHIDGNVDEKDMLPSIIQSQDAQIQPILGTSLFNKLKTLITNGTIGDVGNEIYQTLLQDYVMMCTLKWTLVYFYPYLHGNIANGIIGTRNVDNMTSLSQDEVDNLISIERSNAQFYTERLISYLQMGGVVYPEYNNNQNGGNRLANWNCCGW